MLLFWISLAVAVIANIWMVARISHVSKVYAVVSFLFFPASIVFLFKHWGDPDQDIKFPFVLTLAATLVFYYQVNKLGHESDEAEMQQEQLEKR